MDRWFQIPSDGNMPFLDNLSNKNPGLRTNATMFQCVTCHDPHGVDTALTPTRAFSGANTEALALKKMLRYNYSGVIVGQSPLCSKCHK